MTNEQIWIAFGLTGQLLFTARFVVQWLSSEREKRSVIPPLFWYFSIGGALILLAYAIYRRDAVFIVGQSSGLFIYARNLQLIRNEKRRIAVDTPAPKSEIIQITATAQQRKAA
jgi:lipid-A-disaccharide synthase-like uncharacterized protein